MSEPIETPEETAARLENVVVMLADDNERLCGQWKPIETAPHDHTRVLLYVPPYGVSCGHFDCIWDTGETRWIMHSVLNKSANPTHWMPLPQPPEA